MKCIRCGNNLGENDMFCPNCGTPVQTTRAQANGGNGGNVGNGGMYSYDRPMNSSQTMHQQVNQPINQQTNQQRYAQNNGSSNGDSTTKIVRTCIVVVIIVAILAAVIFVVYNILEAINGDKTQGKVPNNTEPASIITSTESKDQTSSTEYKNQTPSTSTGTSNTMTQTSNNTLTSSTYKVNYEGFELYIPDNLIYEMDMVNDAIIVSDTMLSWKTSLTIEQLPFDQLKQKKSMLSSYFTEVLSAYGAKVSNATIENIDGVEMVLLETDIAGVHMIIGCAGLNSMYAACFEVVNENNDYDRDVIKNITPILKTAKYNGTTQNIEMNSDVKMTDIISALKKATN